MIDHNVAAAHRLFEEPAIGPLEEAMLGALEAHDAAYSKASETQEALRPLFERLLSAWIYPGAEIDLHDRTVKPPRCLSGVQVQSGNARNASRFRILGAPSVRVDASGDTQLSTWQVRAVAISSRTGKEMSANTPNGFSRDGTLVLRGSVATYGYSDLTGPALIQHERDEFIRMVAAAEAILAARGEDTAPSNEAQDPEAPAAPRG